MEPKKLPRNATNAHIAEAVNMVNQTLIIYGRDIGILMQWKRGKEIAKEAVEEYQKEQDIAAARRAKMKESKTRTQVLLDLIPLIVALTVLAYAVASKLGKN